MGKIIESFEHPGGYKIVPVHYSMDPEKDGTWLRATKKRYKKSDWQKEYEIDFRSIRGEKAYENFSLIANTREAGDIKYSPYLPLRLCCDFNVNPMAWVICQVNGKMVYALNEIFLTPGGVVHACRAFLELFPDHEADVWIYGDAQGRARSQQDLSANYDEMEIQFMNRPFKIVRKVPKHNPSEVSRMRAVNRMLSDEQGEARLLICRSGCPELIKDFQQVVVDESGNHIVKVKKEEDPYFFRSHVSDAIGYFITWEFPVAGERRRKATEQGDAKRRSRPKPPPPKGKKRRLLGVLRR